MPYILVNSAPSSSAPSDVSWAVYQVSSPSFLAASSRAFMSARAAAGAKTSAATTARRANPFINSSLSVTLLLLGRYDHTERQATSAGRIKRAHAARQISRPGDLL